MNHDEFNDEKMNDNNSLDSRFLRALETAPREANSLPSDFSAKVAGRIRSARHRRQNAWVFLSTAVFLVFAFWSVYAVCLLLDHKYATTSAASLFRFRWILIAGSAGVAVIQYADNKLVLSRRISSLPPL